MAVDDAYVFPGFLTPVLTQLFFPKPPTTFPTCFCRGERRKYAGKKSSLNWGSNSQPPGHKSNTLTTEPPGRVYMMFWIVLVHKTWQQVLVWVGLLSTQSQQNITCAQIENNHKQQINPFLNNKI